MCFLWMGEIIGIIRPKYNICTKTKSLMINIKSREIKWLTSIEVQQNMEYGKLDQSMKIKVRKIRERKANDGKEKIKIIWWK